MQDIHSLLATLHRPRLMMRAARIGAETYKRESHLSRLLGYGMLPRHAQALMRLVDMESELERQRTGSDGAYAMLRHIDVLIAIVAEARLLRAAHDGPQRI
ncbi:DUF6477 family protein [Sulfitobacter sp. HNIBRBA3233]|uniref:DUF6477 family protein n=1 Tax=Sulfitobacter marinivivus TaxID=3158558 RepID=UPI0032DF2926